MASDMWLIWKSNLPKAALNLSSSVPILHTIFSHPLATGKSGPPIQCALGHLGSPRTTGPRSVQPLLHRPSVWQTDWQTLEPSIAIVRLKMKQAYTSFCCIHNNINTEGTEHWHVAYWMSQQSTTWFAVHHIILNDGRLGQEILSHWCIARLQMNHLTASRK